MNNQATGLTSNYSYQITPTVCPTCGTCPTCGKHVSPQPQITYTGPYAGDPLYSNRVTGNNGPS